MANTSALHIVATEDPFDIILLDYCMPGMEGIKGVSKALKSAKGAKIIVMSGFFSLKKAKEAIEMGASGLMPKSLSAQSAVNALRFVSMGEKFIPFDFMTKADEGHHINYLIGKLTVQELAVFNGLCDAKSNKEIARELGLAEATVKLYVKRVFRKLGLHNRTQAAILGKEVGFR